MSPNDATSLSVLARLQRDDAGAWERFVGLYRPLVLHWCKQAGVDGSDAEDVAQEVFLAVSGGLPQFERQREGSFRTWLRGITRHKLADHYRRRQRQPAAAGGTDALQRLQELPETPDPASDATELRELYRRALELIRGCFEERTFQAFWATAVEGRPTDAVAESLGMSAVAVRIAKSRVLARLRQDLGDLIA
jgi:RNA polymerase sigma-70 factor (ECF subfamily)